MKTSDSREGLEKISHLSRGQKEQVMYCLSEMAPQAAVVKWLEDSFELKLSGLPGGSPLSLGTPSGIATFPLLHGQAHVHGRIGKLCE